MKRWNWCIEWKAADLWVGAFWKRSDRNRRLDIWICVVPCVPLHIWRQR